MQASAKSGPSTELRHDSNPHLDYTIPTQCLAYMNNNYLRNDHSKLELSENRDFLAGHLSLLTSHKIAERT